MNESRAVGEEHGSPNMSHWRDQPRRAICIGLIGTSGIAFSLLFACVTPFAALATLAALKMERRDAVAMIGLVWLTNQAIGYGVLSYPWTWDSAAWGLAIGGSAFLALATGRALATPRPAAFAISLPFVGAFAAYELSLYVVSFVLPGGQSGFTAHVVWQVFLVNAEALVGLWVVYYVARTTGLATRGMAMRGLATAMR